MSIRRPRFAVLLVLACLPSGSVALAAATAEDLSNGPASHLMTDGERDEWKALASPAARAEFERLFWAKRDPDPATPQNELQAEIARRAQYADERLGGDGTRGSMTDRGRVFILLGPPNRSAKEGGSGFADEVGSEGTGGGRGGVGGGAVDFGESFTEVWTYEKDRLPKGLKTNRLLVRFRTERGYGKGVLERSGVVLSALAAAAEGFVVRPQLTAADLASAAPPVAGAPSAAAAAPTAPETAPGAAPLDDAALEAALAGAPATKLRAGLDVHLFQAGDGRWIVPLQVMTAGAPPAGEADLVGVAEREGGERVTFRRRAPWNVVAGEGTIAQTLVLAPGVYTVRAGLVGADGALAWSDGAKLTVPEELSDFWLSDVLVAESIYPMKEKQQLFDPYAWEGVVVVPEGDRTFAAGGGVWWYLHACNASLDAEGKPQLNVVLEVTGARKARGRAQVEPSRAGANCWVLAQELALPADRFTPGEYQLKVQVTDTLAQETLTSAAKFHVAAP